ncbi:Multifunctional conjugation protein TraI [Citrobacter amalonaticus]|nr:Multifunctional conjugation protein TraI [Citrobacter amalonaticus]
MKMQVTLGKIYRSALRQEVEALGHKVEEVGKHGMWEIKGVPEEVREDLSSRGREIEGAVGADATLRSRDVAAKDTRQAKVDPSRLRLMERWLGQLKDKGYDLKAYQASVVPREDASREVRPQPVKSEPEMPGREISANVPERQMQAAEPAGKHAEKGGTAPEQSDVTAPSSSRQPAPQPVLSGPGPVLQPAGMTQTQPSKSLQPSQTPALAPEVMQSVQMAISQLSDSRTRFTFGELMLTTAELSEQLPDMNVIRQAIDASLKDGLIVPLDSEKGVFTSRIHLLDELSIQALSQEHLKSTSVVSFARPEQYAPPALAVVEKDALVLMNAPSGVAGIRDLTAQLTGISVAQGREVQVLASSAERAISLAKSDTLRDRLVSRQQVLSGELQLKPQSTLIIEGLSDWG